MYIFKQAWENNKNSIQKGIKLAPKSRPMSFPEPNPDFVDLECPRGLKMIAGKA